MDRGFSGGGGSGAVGGVILNILVDAPDLEIRSDLFRRSRGYSTYTMPRSVVFLILSFRGFCQFLDFSIAQLPRSVKISGGIGA